MNHANDFIDRMKMEYETRVGDKFFRVEFKTSMVPLIYIKYASAKKDATTSELASAKRSLQFIIYGFNEDGSVRENVTATSPDQKQNNITGSLEKVYSELSKIVEAYL